MSSPKKSVLCQKCKHFYITWETQTPNGCHQFGIKTRRLPCDVIKQETGNDCLGFTPKKTSLNKNSKIDLNDDSLW